MSRLLAASCAALALWAGAACAQERTGHRDGFVLKPGTARIVLMRPRIDVGAQSTGGMAEPNADWSEQARGAIGRALAAAQGRLGNVVVDHVEPVGDDARRVAEYRSLFDSLAMSVVTYQFFPGNRLPTKKRDGSFVWSIGRGIATLPGLEDADYALFITTEDQYGSTGRKLLQFASAMAGIGISSGVHTGLAGLIDLKTGDLVWLNADLRMGGDVRTPEGAERRVAQLLEGFPGRPAAPVPAPVQVSAR